MKTLQIILPIAVGALIGYFTNYIAIKMLFRPRKQWYIGKWKLPFTPGVIPKNKPRIATAVANAVSEELLTKNDMIANLKNSDIKDSIVDSVTKFILDDKMSIKSLVSNFSTEKDCTEAINCLCDVLSEKMLQGIKRLDMNEIISDIAQSSFSGLLSNPMLAMFLGNSAINTVCSKMSLAITEYIDSNGQMLIVPMIRQEVNEMASDSLKNNLIQLNLDEAAVHKLLSSVVDKFIDNNLPVLIKHIGIKDIVEEKINQMDAKELEKLVLSVMKNELQAVVNLGAIIGAIIGIINIFI